MVESMRLIGLKRLGRIEKSILGILLKESQPIASRDLFHKFQQSHPVVYRTRSVAYIAFWRGLRRLVRRALVETYSEDTGQRKLYRAKGYLRYCVVYWRLGQIHQQIQERELKVRDVR
jgi:hypothetical protein